MNFCLNVTIAVFHPLPFTGSGFSVPGWGFGYGHAKYFDTQIFCHQLCVIINLEPPNDEPVNDQ